MQEPNMIEPADLIVKGNKSFHLFGASISLILPFGLLMDKRDFFLHFAVSLDYVFHLVLLLFFLTVSIYLWQSYLDKSPQLVLNNKGVFYKALTFKPDKWRIIEWSNIQHCYVIDKTHKGVSDGRVVFVTKDEKSTEIGISNYEVSEIDIIKIIEKYSTHYNFAFLKEL